ncbi:amidohydrolase (plasmid) [Phaeobacter inhibens]|uniref:amidohydrolase n=1 Tax=Phaeobacter inhibens TaxID=221822 RepID=UPI0001632868|nr:amidohydrolase [Phaeobacter inhibens]AFO93456.1 putative amidohydrolase [Phaeobacter inhibens DSM 17395]AUQ48156.1 putative amidohydrolase [Phaeobacter inhibens]AXT24948.1 amidohydrolase [Phaeobacter inhibens]
MNDSTLYFNGTIQTMDAQNTVVEAVLTLDEKITSVGTEADLRVQMPKDTTLVDLQGQTMIPAFIDPHGHFPDSGFVRLFRVELSPPPLGDCTTIAIALARLASCAAKTPKGEWVMGAMFDQNSIAEKRMPTREELDSISTDHPIWVMLASGHGGAANSAVLKLRGLDRDTPDPVGGHLGRDPKTGDLNGHIEGISAMGDLGDTNFLIDRDRFWQGFYSARDEYLSYGVTYAQNSWAGRDMLEHFASMPADKDPGFDVMLLPIGELEPELTDGPDALQWPGNPHFTLGPRKLFSDGSIPSQTAYLTAPYHKPIDPENLLGHPYVTVEEHRYQVKKLHDLGYQIHCHCNGDAAAEMFITAVELALADTPRKDHRHTLLHGQVLRDDQLRQMATLGMTVSFFPAHIYFWGDRHYNTFLGPERAERISPAGSAERCGVRFTIHNDAAVTPTRPIHLAHCAVDRMTSTGRLLGADQRISVLSALRAQTIDAAWQVFQEDTRGSIEAGKLADFAILNQNPIETPQDILGTQVVQTIRRGVSVFGEPLKMRLPA